MGFKEESHWEDSYTATIFDTFGELISHARDYWTGPLSCYNWPVWIEYGLWEGEPGQVTVGVFLPRHGRCDQVIAPATGDQVAQLRRMIMDCWAARADSQFRRYTSTAHEIVTEARTQ